MKIFKIRKIMMKLRFLFLVSVLAGSAVPVQAAPPVWKNVALGGGGAIIGICADPNVQGLFYMRADIGGAYRWDPANSRWIPITEKLPKGTANDFGIDSIVVDPSHGKTVYILTGKYPYAKGGHIYKSTDAGDTWTALATPPEMKSKSNGPGRKYGERLGVDPNDPQVLAVATRNVGFWISADGGATWTQKGAFAPPPEKASEKNYSGMSFVAFDKGSGKTGSPTPILYVGTFDRGADGGVWKSTDAGETWKPMTGGLPTPARCAVASDGTVYVTCLGGGKGDTAVKGAVFKAARNATSFTDCTPPTEKPERQSYVGLALDPANPQVVCVSQCISAFGLDTFRSTDAGATWTAAGKLHGATDPATRDGSQWFGNIGQIVMNPFQPKEVWMADWLGVLRTPDITDPTKPWDYLAAGDEEIVPLCLVCPPSGAPLLSGDADVNGAVHASLTAPPPQSFSHTSKPVSIGSTTSLDFCEADPKCWARVMGSFVGSPNGLFSTDGGNSWLPFPSIPPGARHGRVAVSATDPNVIVWQSEDGNLYYTADRGKTWAKSATAPSIKVGEFQQDVQPLTSDRVTGSTFYLLKDVGGESKSEVWRSTDGGATWAVASTIPHPSHVSLFQCKLLATPGVAGNLWLDLANVGLFKSSDGGSTFTALPDVNNAGVFALGKPAPNHKNPTLFFLGSVKKVGGIFRSNDDGVTWEQINNPETPINDAPKVMGADRQVYGRAYIGTDGRGIYYDDVPAQ
jgi:photosystem II stability/assembly factor-like uncharacterized protein